MDEPAPTVYLVDDDPDVLRALSRLLQSAEMKVATFASAQEFLDGHDRSAPGCVVLDLAMPGLNGLRAAAGAGARGLCAADRLSYRPRRHRYHVCRR